jgi:hypothetical protein
VIKGNFHSFVGTKAVGSSSNHSDFVVEALNGAIGDFSFCPKPIQDRRLMGAQHPGHPFHRFETATHGPEAPIVEKAAGPDHGFVLPEMGEGLLQIPGPCGGQLAGQQGIELLPGPPAYPVWSEKSIYLNSRIELSTRKVEIAGIAAATNGLWMGQIGRNLTDAVEGILNGKRYLIHDRDPLFTAEFLNMLADVGVKSVKLPCTTERTLDPLPVPADPVLRWMNQRQLLVIGYLRGKIRVLREQFGGFAGAPR